MGSVRVCLDVYNMVSELAIHNNSLILKSNGKVNVVPLNIPSGSVLLVDFIDILGKGYSIKEMSVSHNRNLPKPTYSAGTEYVDFGLSGHFDRVVIDGSTACLLLIDFCGKKRRINEESAVNLVNYSSKDGGHGYYLI